MTRTEKFRKLGNAIRTYRGITHPDRFGRVKWHIAPDKNRLADIVWYLEILGLPVDKSVASINGFKSMDEFAAWMKEAQNG